MNCRQFEHFLDQYLDGDLEGTLKLEFEAHLVDCEGCGHMFGMMQAMGEIIAAPSPEEPRLSRDFSDRVLAGMNERRTTRIPWRAARISLAASIGLVAALTMVFSLPRSSTSQPKASAAKTHFAFNQPTKRGPTAQVAGMAQRRKAEPASQTELKFWLAGTIEQAGTRIWELNELRTAAFDQLRQDVFSSLAGQTSSEGMKLQPQSSNLPIAPAAYDLKERSTPTSENPSRDSDYELL